MIVENRPGADGVIGTDYVAKSAPDGYTIAAIGGSSFHPALVKNLPFNLTRDMQPVILVRVGDSAVMANANFPARNLKELQAWAKANPGKLNFGGSTVPTTLATEMLKKALGIDGVVVPYKGSAPVVTALLAGEVQVSLDPPIAYQQHVVAGKLRFLAITGKQRLSIFPDAPTTVEQGVNFTFGTNTGYWLPGGTPMPIVERLNREINEVIRTPEFRKYVESTGGVVMGGMPEEFRSWIVNDQNFLAEGARLIKYEPQ
jgi:tripartite-type tricarboxylate transporter receptor subunit TctC